MQQIDMDEIPPEHWRFQPIIREKGHIIINYNI
jgi:hypothetical protein